MQAHLHFSREASDTVRSLCDKNGEGIISTLQALEPKGQVGFTLTVLAGALDLSRIHHINIQWVGPRAYPLTKQGKPRGGAPTEPLSLLNVAHRFKSLAPHQFLAKLFP